MITISEAVEEIISGYPFLEELIVDGIINYSALARKIKKDVEKITYKDVKTGAIIMALRRLSQEIKPKIKLKKLLKGSNDITVRSNLVELVVKNYNFSADKYQKIIKIAQGKEYFITVTQGIFETVIIASNQLFEKIEKILKKEKIAYIIKDLSSITIHLPEDNVSMVGVYYLFLKALAWQGINIIEVISTYSELTVIISDHQVSSAFFALKKIVKR